MIVLQATRYRRKFRAGGRNFCRSVIMPAIKADSGSSLQEQFRFSKKTYIFLDLERIKPYSAFMNKKVTVAVGIVSLGFVGLSQAATTYFGPVGGDMGDAANWDNGLPDNVGNVGTVPTGFGQLTGSPLNKDIIFNGDSGFNANDFNNNLANGYNVTFNGTGNADFNSGLFLGWDPGAANDSTLTWNSTGTATANRMFSSRFAGGTFTQSAGTINQTATGGFDMVGGEFGPTAASPNAGTTWTMSGGVFNSSATQFQARFGTMNQSGGDFNLNLLSFSSGGNWNWDLSGGSVNLTDLSGFGGSDSFNFSTDSTGVLNVTSANYSIGDAEADINSGWITLDGSATTPSNFLISEAGGITRISVIPEASIGLLAGLGALGLFLRRRRA